MERTEREFDDGERRWRAVEAWRGGGGYGLLYFLPLEGDGEAADERLDRRAALEPGEELAELDDDELARRKTEGAPLTVTERRFEAPDGRPWLAQSVGPVWAEDVASGMTGLLFTSLAGPPRRLSGGGGHAGRASPGELRRQWREAASAGPGEGDEAGSPAHGCRDGGGGS